MSTNFHIELSSGSGVVGSCSMHPNLMISRGVGVYDRESIQLHYVSSLELACTVHRTACRLYTVECGQNTAGGTHSVATGHRLNPSQTSIRLCNLFDFLNSRNERTTSIQSSMTRKLTRISNWRKKFIHWKEQRVRHSHVRLFIIRLEA